MNINECLGYRLISLSSLLITFPLNAATVTNLQGESPSVLKLFQQNSIATFSTIRSVQQHTDKKGIVHKKYLQSFRGIPIWGQHIATHQQGSSIQSINGSLIEKIELDVPVIEAAFDNTEAIAKAKTWVTQQDATILWDYKREQANLFIYVNESQQAKLVYQVDLLAQSTDPLTNSIIKVSRPQFIIDAFMGIILKQWEGLTDNKIGTGPGGNIRIPDAPYEYGSGGGYDFRATALKCLAKHQFGTVVIIPTRFAAFFCKATWDRVEIKKSQA